MDGMKFKGVYMDFKEYIVPANNNVWEPGVYGWEEVL